MASGRAQRRVVLLDLDLYFGDAALQLDAAPTMHCARRWNILSASTTCSSNAPRSK